MTFPRTDAQRRSLVQKLRDIHRPDPLADAVESDMGGDKPVHRRTGKRSSGFEVVGHRRYSPKARFHDAISAAADEAKLIKTTVAEPSWYSQHAGIDYDHSNLTGRKPLPGGEQHDFNVLDLDSRGDRQLFKDSMEVSTVGPSGRCVVLVDPEAPRYTPNLPVRMRDGDVEPSVVAFPISYGYTTERIARIVMARFASGCRWCSSTGAEPSWGLIYTAGATAYVFPACYSCWADLNADFHDSGALDWVANDGFFGDVGFPSDRHY